MLKIRGFCVANLRNSQLLRAIRRLESTHFKRKLFHPELIRGTLGFGGLKERVAYCVMSSKFPVLEWH